jgi:hypothetical protein
MVKVFTCAYQVKPYQKSSESSDCDGDSKTISIRINQPARALTIAVGNHEQRVSGGHVFKAQEVTT